jgi:hypothetical protein
MSIYIICIKEDYFMKKATSLLILSLMCSTTYGKAINFDELVQQDIPTIKGKLNKKLDQCEKSKGLYKELATHYATKASHLEIFSKLEIKQLQFMNSYIEEKYKPSINLIRELKGTVPKLTPGLIKETEEETKANILVKFEKANKKAQAYKKAYTAAILQMDHLEALAKLPDEELIEGINLRLEYLKKFDVDHKKAKKEGPIFFNKGGQYVKKNLLKDNPNKPVLGASSPTIPFGVGLGSPLQGGIGSPIGGFSLMQNNSQPGRRAVLGANIGLGAPSPTQAFGASTPAPAFGTPAKPAPIPMFGAPSATSSTFGASSALQGNGGSGGFSLPVSLPSDKCSGRRMTRGARRCKRGQ